MSLLVAILVLVVLFWYVRREYRLAFRTHVSIINGRQAMVVRAGEGTRWAELMFGQWFWEDSGERVERKVERLIEMALEK